MRATIEQRLKILEIAISSMHPDQESPIAEVVDRAKVFETYATGEDVDISNLPSQVGTLEENTPPVVATRKTRGPNKTKTEETKTETHTVAATAGVPVSYLEVQKAVVALVQQKGRPAGEKVLEQFGVANAKQLKEDQYAEAVQAFTDALNG